MGSPNERLKRHANVFSEAPFCDLRRSRKIGEAPAGSDADLPLSDVSGVSHDEPRDSEENRKEIEMSNEMVVPETGEIVEEVDSGLVFGTKDPDLIIEKATKIANRLVEIVEKAKLYAMIKDKKYVKAEGWTTMAAMLGVFPRVVAVERLEREEGFAYSAKVDLRTLSDALVGSGEAICSSVERFGVGKDEYAVKSMAQTRALGKACRISFSWIMALAGFEPTPAEEMIGDGGTFRSVAMPRAKETSREATVVQS